MFTESCETRDSKVLQNANSLVRRRTAMRHNSTLLPSALLNRATRIRISRRDGVCAKESLHQLHESFATSVTKFVDLPRRH